MSSSRVVCFTHLEDPHSFIEAVKRLLTVDGRFIIEVEYIGNILQTIQFERFYLDRIFLLLADLAETPVRISRHGDRRPSSTSSRMAARLQVTMRRMSGSAAQSARVDALLKGEGESLTAARLAEFRSHVDKQLTALRDLLVGYKKSNIRIAGYGAPARVSTICNYGNIGPSLIEFTVDDSPLKQNKFTPGNAYSDCDQVAPGQPSAGYARRVCV